MILIINTEKGISHYWRVQNCPSVSLLQQINSATSTAVRPNMSCFADWSKCCHTHSRSSLSIVVRPNTSCFADWSKRRHVTLSTIEWRTIHGHDLVTTEISQEVVWHVEKCQTDVWHVKKYLMSRERRHMKNVKTQEVASSIPARSLNQTFWFFLFIFLRLS